MIEIQSRIEIQGEAENQFVFESGDERSCVCKTTIGSSITLCGRLIEEFKVCETFRQRDLHRGSTFGIKDGSVADVNHQPELGDDHLARWRRISEEAARQSGRSRVPRVEEVTGFAEALVGVQAESSPAGKLIAHPGAETPAWIRLQQWGGREVALYLAEELKKSIQFHERITIRGKGLERAPELIGRVPGVSDIRGDRNQVICRVDSRQKCLNSILEAVLPSGAIIENIEITKPTLGDVFVALANQSDTDKCVLF